MIGKFLDSKFERGDRGNQTRAAKIDIEVIMDFILYHFIY